MKTQREYIYLLLLTVFAFVLFTLYQPGLHGSIFLLDDHVNLHKLANIQSFSDWSGLVGFISNSVSSSVGRPISMLSFAVQFNAWPGCPYCFKLANLFIHIINGFLIFFLTRNLASAPNVHMPRKDVLILSVLVAVAWLAHPIQVSTVLYTIQRMAEISAFFTLIGLILYIKGRLRLGRTYDLKGYLFMTAGAGCAFILGILSKENAILFAVYILTLEITVFSGQHHKYLKLWLFVFSLLPIFILVLYLFPKVYPYFLNEYPGRTFSAYDRLLTEFRVLTDYLFKIWIPRLGTFGLFHANFELSTGLLSPINTLFALIINGLLVFIAFKARHRYPIASFGILFFYAAHLLESTVLNLELYFEHRNYLASYGALLTAFIVLLHFYRSDFFKNKTKRKLVFTVFVVAWTSMALLITLSESKLWGHPDIQAQIWAEKNPMSYRAQGHYSHILTQTGQYQKAYLNYKKNMDILVGDAAIPILWLQLRCYDQTIPYPDFQKLKKRIYSSEFQNAALNTFNEIAQDISTGACLSLDPKEVSKLLDLFIETPAYQYDQSLRSLLIIKSKLQRISNDLSGASESLERANSIQPSADVILSLMYLYVDQQMIKEARRHYSELLKFCDKHPLQCLPHKQEIEILGN